MEGDRLKILAVDDDRIARVIYEAAGKLYGFDLILVEDGESALGALRTVQFDLVLMDWRLPDLDGMTCVRLVREEQQELGSRYTPIIAVTASAMAGDREKCLEAGCDDYLSKPFDLDELNAKIRFWTTRITRFRRSRNTG